MRKEDFISYVCPEHIQKGWYVETYDYEYHLPKLYLRDLDNDLLKNYTQDWFTKEELKIILNILKHNP